jgi:hypothetical protein
MYARAVEDAASELRHLRWEEWGDFGLAGLSLSSAVAATAVYPALALPLFVGGLVVGSRGLRALWRRWDAVDRLAGESDAYVISEVLAYATRETTMDRRRTFAALIRSRLRKPLEPRLEVVAEELDLLACELENAELWLDPASAVACMRLLSDFTSSPLLNSALPPQDLHSRVNHIRSGFRAERVAARMPSSSASGVEGPVVTTDLATVEEPNRPIDVDHRHSGWPGCSGPMR